MAGKSGATGLELRGADNPDTSTERSMTYVKETRKDVAQATKDLEAAVARHGFGVLHTYDLHETLQSKGFPIRNACRVLEVCNPRHAQAVLDHEMALNMALPCRISVNHDSSGGNYIDTASAERNSRQNESQRQHDRSHFKSSLSIAAGAAKMPFSRSASNFNLRSYV